MYIILTLIIILLLLTLNLKIEKYNTMEILQKKRICFKNSETDCYTVNDKNHYSDLQSLYSKLSFNLVNKIFEEIDKKLLK